MLSAYTKKIKKLILLIKLKSLDYGLAHDLSQIIKKG